MYKLANLLKWKGRPFDLSDENDWLDLLDDFGPSLPRFLLDGSCAPSIPDGDAALNELRQSLVKNPVSSLTPDVGSVWVLFVYDDRLDGLPWPFRHDGVLLPFEWRRDCESHSELLPEALLRLADKVKLQYGDEARDCTLHPSRHFLDAVDFRVYGDEFKFTFDSAWGALATGLHLLLSRKKELKAWPFSTIAYDFENGVPQAVGGLDRKLLLAASAGAEEIAVAPVQYREARKTLAALQAEHPKDKTLSRLRIYHWRQSGDLRRSVAALAKCNQPKYRKRILFCVASLFMFALPCLMGYAYWLDWKAERIEYYKDYVEVAGVPRGIGELSPAQIKGRGQAYRFVYQGYDSWIPWKRKPVLRKMFCVNSFGHVRNEGKTLPLHANVAGRVFCYDEKNRLTQVRYLEIDGALKEIHNYFGRESQYIDIVRRGVDGRLGTSPIQFDGGGKMSKADMIRRYCVQRDVNGHVVRWDGFRDMRGVLSWDADGVSRKDYVLDDLGRVVKETAYSWNDQAQALKFVEHCERTFVYEGFDVVEMQRWKDGCCHLVEKYVHDTHGNVVEIQRSSYDSAGLLNGPVVTKYAYDENGECCLEECSGAKGRQKGGRPHRRAVKTKFSNGSIVERDESYYDENGQVDCQGKVSRQIMRYDANMRCVEHIRYGKGGMRLTRREGIAVLKRRYDSQGLLLEETTYDDKGNLCLNQSGFARKAIERITDGEELRKNTSYYGVEGRLLCIPETGAAKEEMRYDKNGLLIAVSLFGARGEAVIGTSNWHKTLFRHNRFGYLTEIAYYGLDGELVRAHGFGGDVAIRSCDVATQRYAINGAGQVVELSLHDVSGALMKGSQNWARITKSYDANGRLAEVALFDEVGNPVEPRDGINCRTQYYYDDNGNKKRQRAFTIDGGYIESEYDDKGHELVNRTYSADGRPRADDTGVHAVVFEYDSLGREIKRGFLNVAGKRTLNEQRYAALETNYDNMGFEYEKRRLGVNGELVRDINGVCIVRRHYDKMYRDAGRSFYDANTNLVENKDGVAGVRKKYDAEGNLSEEYNIDHKGRPIPDAYGVSIVHCEFDQHRRVIKRTFFNGEHKPTLNTEGIAGLTIEYHGDSERESVRRFFGLDGKPCHIKNGRAGYMMEYDARGNLVKEVDIDTQGKPFADADGIVGTIRKYDKRNRLIQERWMGEDMKPCSKSFDMSPLFTGRVDCCRCEFSQDEQQGRTTSILVLSKAYEGVKKVVKTYDRVGNCVEISFTDDNDKLVETKRGFARVQNEFNVYRDLTAKRWYGANNALRTNGCARFEGTYSHTSSGLSVRFNWYDAQGYPATNEQGVASCRMEYDREYRLVEMESLNCEKKLVGIFDELAKCSVSRDDNGRIVSFSAIKADGKGAFDGIARIDLHYEHGDTVVVAGYDEEGRNVEERKARVDDGLLMKFQKKINAMRYKPEE